MREGEEAGTTTPWIDYLVTQTYISIIDSLTVDDAVDMRKVGVYGEGRWRF